MNARDKMRKQLEGQSLLDRRFQWRDGDIKINVGNTMVHELAKCLVVYEMKLNGHAVVTEAIFKNGRRADVFVLDELEVIEIVESEGEESIEKKRVDYEGIGVSLRAFKATEIVNQWLKTQRK